ncbi:MAG: Dehydrogenases (flavoprotein) [Halonotius sp. J07HN6]|nr:MAG: Dehydrogenases (flavoprotein) [Halonotius sp. J07HN6]
MERADVAIIGGGPAGMAAAHAAASEGADALVLEKGVPRADREGMGPDSTDAAGILDYWVDLMEIHPDEMPDDVIHQELDRAEFVGPTESCTLTSTGIESSYDHFGYTFHRARFDDWLRERAEMVGATYRVGVRVRDVDTDLTVDTDSEEPRHRVHTAGGETVGADFVVLADGPQRTVTNQVLDDYLPADMTASERLAAPEVNHIAYQSTGDFPRSYLRNSRPRSRSGGATCPVTPPTRGSFHETCLSGRADDAIGLDIDAVENREDYPLLAPGDETIPDGETYIRRLLELEWGDEYDIESDFPLVEDHGKRDGTETYSISSTQPIESPVEAGIAVAGGAMGTTSAFHEGGDHVAIRTGAIAGRLAAAGDLSGYNDRWKNAIGNELVRNVTFADLCRSYGPDDWDQAFETVRGMATAKGLSLLSLSALKSGFAGLQRYYQYKKRKRQFIRNGYTQLIESEYVY